MCRMASPAISANAARSAGSRPVSDWISTRCVTRTPAATSPVSTGTASSEPTRTSSRKYGSDQRRRLKSVA